MKFRDIHCVRKPVYRGTHGSARTLKRRLGVRFSAASVSRFCLVAGCQFDTPAFFGVNLVHRDSRCEAQTHAIPCVGLVVQSVLSKRLGGRLVTGGRTHGCFGVGLR